VTCAGFASFFAIVPALGLRDFLARADPWV
jgi:hypothetical protein